MRVLITGATGLIGNALRESLTADGHEVVTVTRSPSDPNDIGWDPDAGRMDLSPEATVDAAVHLAGENIASGRWTRNRKARIMESRRLGTQLLCEKLASLSTPPRVLVSASGVNYYPSNTGEIATEETGPGNDFLSEVCQAWEGATRPALDAGIRVALLRFGVVLTPDGGALAKMLPLFKTGAGGRLGDGKQRMTWIALEDVVGIIRRAIDDDHFSGAFNAVAPQIVTNAVFTEALAAALRRPAPFPAPAFALRLALGEMADAALLADLAVEPARLKELGYEFRQPELAAALQEMVR